MSRRSVDVAVVGMACRYPGASNPRELWENALAGRRAFRRIPAERLRLEDYRGDDPDSIYVQQAALLEDWELDRVAFRIAGASWRAADHAHWLALEVAARALDDAGAPGGEGLDREATGVLVGNSLTGEFSRAGLMRLRWPYVRRTVGATLAEAGWDEARREELLADLEQRYKEPFPEPGEETLAGGLANTIAGRIANHFDFHGGGYTVDGACASSLLAVSGACSALAAGDLEVAIAGGVDLSLDPFELVGFSRTGAFTRDRMRIYDQRSAGFLPGEGCGMVVLMPLESAQRDGLRVHAVIRGWGLSSDGAGGLTRPKAEGQLLALRRAYGRAGLSPSGVGYFEGHGTGTAVGDPVELEALGRARRELAGGGDADAAGADEGGVPPAAVGSVKAIIGHTKAAAGIAGLLKAAMAVREGVLPPTIGCEEPHAVLLESPGSPALRALDRAEPWPAGVPRRAGVSAFGFGGINTHVVVEAPGGDAAASGPRPGAEPVALLPERVRRLDASRQDAELLLLAAPDRPSLARRAAELAARAEGLSEAELTDLAVLCADEAAAALGGMRGSVVASGPAEAAARLRGLAAALEDAGEGANGADGGDGGPILDLAGGYAAGAAGRPPRLGFLFPGQGVLGRRRSGRTPGGAWARRFPEYEAVVRRADLAGPGEEPGAEVATEVVQPAVAAASLGALAVLDRLGLQGVVGVGHSLGELTALAWAGALDGDALVRLAKARGAAMAAVPGEGGAMAGLACPTEVAAELVEGTGAVVAGHNAPRQTVVSGPLEAVEAVADRARRRGISSTRLRVSHAFHSPAMAPAAAALTAALEREAPGRLVRRVVSTITGDEWPRDADVPALLVRQLTDPVLFTRALEVAGEGVDLWIEVGPGQVLGELARRCGTAPAISLDAGGAGLAGLLTAVGTAWALGARLEVEELFRDRYSRPLVEHRFLTNPCEAAPLDDGAPAAAKAAAATTNPAALPATAEAAEVTDPLELLRRLVAERAELPPEAVGTDHRMLSDLHLNSIAVGQLVVEAARRVGAPPPASPTDYADASVGEIASVLASRAGTERADEDSGPPPGVDAWVRAFRRRLDPRPLADGERLGGCFRLVAGDRTAGDGASGEVASDADDSRLAAALVEHLAAGMEPAGEGVEPDLVVLLMPEDPGAEDLKRLLATTKAALGPPASPPPTWSDEEPPSPAKGAAGGGGGGRGDRHLPRWVLVHRGGGAGFARSFHLERPEGEVVVVGLPPGGGAELASRVAAEARAPVPGGGYREAVFDAGGERRVPRLEAVPPAPPGPGLPLGPDDVLLVTGGGRGIAVECALELAQATGAGLVLVGRSRPEEVPELAENLERFAAASVRFRYLSADVTDAAALAAAVAEAEGELGPVTGILHGAGHNRPRLVAALTAEDVERTLAVKVRGLEHALAAVEPERLRLLVAFGSIIAEMGVRGEADYALANELLALRVERFAADHPACRCLTAEWSVWSGVGMGERLGTLESLRSQGISPIPPDRGVAELMALLSRSDLPPTLVVAGRFGTPPTVEMEVPELPFLRFLESPRVHVPGVELVVETEISDASDPYLADHVFDGERLFPAVLGLEAMAQAALVVAGRGPAPGEPLPASVVAGLRFEDVRFERPISVPAGERATLRVAALMHGPDRVETVLRSSASGFQVDHFRAVCRWDRDEDGGVPEPAPERSDGAGEAVALDPATELYGGVLFHTGRFCRLTGYRLLRATRCIAEIGPSPEGGAGGWFARHLPSTLLLGDPGARDAVIHGVQASIPHAVVLPTGVERLVPGRLDAGAAHRVESRERSRDGRNLVYDLVVLDAAGRTVERWEGLGLRAVSDLPAPPAWPLPLLSPHLERRLGDLVPGARPSVVVTAAGGSNGDRRAASDRAVAAAAGGPVVRFRRPDGRRVPGKGARHASGNGADAGGGTDPGGVSVAHGDGLVMAMVGDGVVGCDLEPVAHREAAVWRDLLGGRAVLAEHLADREPVAPGSDVPEGHRLDVAATRVWAAGEALKKMGLPVDAPLTFVSATLDGWTLLASGGQRVAVLVTRVRDVDGPLAVALAVPASRDGASTADADRLRAS